MEFKLTRGKVILSLLMGFGFALATFIICIIDYWRGDLSLFLGRMSTEGYNSAIIFFLIFIPLFSYTLWSFIQEKRINQEEQGIKKDSKLAISSFIISLIGITPIFLFIIKSLFVFNQFLWRFMGNISNVAFFFAWSISPFAFPISLITSIISLILIKKNNLEGKRLAISALIISIIGLLIIWWFLANLDLSGVWS